MSDIEIHAAGEAPRTADADGMSQGNCSYTVEYILSRLEKIQNDSVVFTERLFDMIAKNKSGGPGDIGAQGNGQALAAMAAEHESTNRKLIDFYQKMYDDLLKKQ